MSVLETKNEFGTIENAYRRFEMTQNDPFSTSHKQTNGKKWPITNKKRAPRMKTGYPETEKRKNGVSFRRIGVSEHEKPEKRETRRLESQLNGSNPG
jgi:hypothetical protein